VYSLSRSASYMALIGAIEPLIPPEHDPPRCETCRRSIGKGPTALFKDFLETPTHQRQPVGQQRDAGAFT
jgi:hypothetical protein